MKNKNRSTLAEAYRKAGPYLGLGVEFTAAILLCFFAGRWLDHRLGTTPWLSLGGAFLGMAAGFYNLIRAAMRLQNRRGPKNEDRA